jgi:broad specificity phosphatase PhoE
MKLLVVRHGECIANVQGIVAGSRDDSPLTNNGEAQAQAVTSKLTDTHLDAIMATPLQRSRRSAEIIRDLLAPSLTIEIEPDLTELDVGEATGLPLDEYFAREKAGDIPGAETAEQFFTRISRAIGRLRQRQGTILLVTHNGTYRMMECVLQGRPAPDFAHISGLHNGEVKSFTL